MIELPAMRHDAKAEQAVIGCLMHAANSFDSTCLDAIFDALPVEALFNSDYRAIYTAVKEIRSSKGDAALDVLLVSRQCRIEHASAQILEALDSVIGTHAVESYITIVNECARQRGLLTGVLDALRDIKSGVSVDDATESLQGSLAALKETERSSGIVTATQAADGYMHYLSSTDRALLRTALPELDYSLGGGVDFGEMIVVAARPSHGKTAIALQHAHNWTEDGLPVLYVSLEMSAQALGKRMLQYSSKVPEECWRRDLSDVRHDFERHQSMREEIFIADNIKSLDSIAREVERSVRQRGVKAVIIDYAQLITGPGKSRYEIITNISTVLRGMASEHNIAMLVLCQMSRDIESRKRFTPIMSDIKESGQFEQDADVVMFLVWPHRINSASPAHEFQFFVAKNRNRPIMSTAFVARFEPGRQRVVSPTARDMPNYEPAFDQFEPDPWPSEDQQEITFP